MATIEKRGENSYRIGISCGFDSQNKRIVKYKTIKLSPDLPAKQIEKELAVEVDKFEKEVQTGTYLNGDITLKEFAEKWLKDYAEIHLRPKTLTSYKYILNRILIALGHKKLDNITPTHLMEFYKNLSEGGIRLDYTYKLKKNIISDIPDIKKKLTSCKINSRTINSIIKGGNTTRPIVEKICETLNLPVKNVFDIINKEKKLSSVTINHHHKLICDMLNVAVQWQLIMSNPAERVKPPKVTKKEAKYYDIDELNQMLALLEAEPIKYRTMIYIVVFCGLRLGELTDLEWSDIDFRNQTITVSKQLQYLPEHGIYELNDTKTDSGKRTISFPSMLAELLTQYKEWQDNEKKQQGDNWSGSNKLFTKENGEPIFPDTPSKWFGKFIKRNNLPPLTFHQLRHTNASLLIGQGVDVATVSKRLGHADKSVTLKVYTHALKQHDREAADKLENLLIRKDKS